jgi:hypothetical protein
VPWRFVENSLARRRPGNGNMRPSADGHLTIRTTTTHG